MFLLPFPYFAIYEDEEIVLEQTLGKEPRMIILTLPLALQCVLETKRTFVLGPGAFKIILGYYLEVSKNRTLDVGPTPCQNNLFWKF